MTTVQAVSAAAFDASLGVNVHLSDNAGPYGNLSMVEAELTFLGINQVRDNQPYDWSVGFYQTIAAAGIKLDLIIGHEPGEAMNTADLQSDLALIDQIASATPNSISVLEGLNEPYNFPNTWNGQSTDNWTTVGQVQAAEYALVRADPKLAGVAVLGTSTDTNSFSDAPQNLASVSDFGNAHVYPYGGGQPPFVMNNIVSGQAQIVPGKPAWITEYGYSTAYLDTNYGIDQTVQAKNTINGLLEAFKNGIPKTFIYQLNDEVANPSASDLQNNWGLFNADGSRKLAATAIHDLTSILADTAAGAATFKPGQISYTIGNLPSTGQSLLMEKSSGAYDLAVWNDGVDWNGSSHSEMAVATTTTTVSFATAYANVSVFDPLSGTAPIATYRNASSLQVSLTDHPLIIELSGASSSPTPTPAPSANGTKITSASAAAIIDQAGNAWRLVQSATHGLQISVNGAVDAVTGNVTLLEILNGSIVQENTSGNWYSEPGPSGPWTQVAAPVTPTPAPTPSPNATKITSASGAPIIDRAGNVWTLKQSASNGLQIAVNGTVDAVTANVTLLEILNGSMVQENTSGNWYSEPGPSGPWTQIAAPVTPTPTPTSSTNGTKITSASATPIIDRAGNAWTLVQSATQGLQIAVNGKADPVTANVKLLENLNGSMVQENTSNNWYSESAPSGPWTQIAPVTPAILTTNDFTGKVSSTSGKIAGTTQIYGATILVTASGTAKVTIGATADTLTFIAMSSVSATAGSAASRIIADGGKNTFTAASAAIDITGGAGPDAYIYHKGNGLMTIEDFSFAKGDTMTIDKSLQTALKQAVDGHGGVLLSFGTVGQGIDLRNVTSLPSSQLHFA